MSDDEREDSWSNKYVTIELKIRKKKVEKIWNLTARGKFCKAMFYISKIRKKSNRWHYGSDIPKKLDKAFQEALVAQLTFTLHLIPKSDKSNFDLKLHIENLLKK